MANLEQKSHNSNQKDQSTGDLFHLSPVTKTTPAPTKGLDASSSRMPPITKWPCSISDGTEATALEMILNPPDRQFVFVGEQSGPLTLQAADQLARRGDMSES